VLHALVCLALALACGGTPPDPAAPAEVPPAPQPAATPTPAAGPVSTTAPAAPAATTDLATAVQGDWAIALGDEERRQVQILELALKDPPATEQELAAAGLSADEKMMVGLLSAARARSPDDPKVKDMESAVANLHAATVHISDRDLSFTAGEVTRHATYTVQGADGMALTILSTDDDGSQDTTVLTLESPDVLLLSDAKSPNRTQRFTRR